LAKYPHPDAFLDLVGEEIVVSDWHTITQAQIDKFADATGDHQWLHVDPERAAREMP
jgi:acyl dehydratase